MLTKQDIGQYSQFTNLFLNKKQNGQVYDLRKNGKDTGIVGRWIDQKCTPDVFYIILDSIVNYIEDFSLKNNVSTTDVAIDWKSLANHQYTVLNIHNLFSKPSTTTKAVKNEYNKFFGQQLELLTYAGLLSKGKRGKGYKVNSINDWNLIEELSQGKQRVVEIFLYSYVKYVLEESGLSPFFVKFLTTQNTTTFYELRNEYIYFYKKYTNSCTKSSSTDEITRIFPKVLNLICYIEDKRGTKGGHLSENMILLTDINYNRENFRDKNKNKPKGMSRQQHSLANPNKFVVYYEAKAKKLVKNNNKKREEAISLPKTQCPLGEAREDDLQYPFNAQEAHHMIARHENMLYSDWTENLILLTPNQHTVKAHPQGNTQVVDKMYQKYCFVSKYEIILNNLNEPKSIYNLVDYFKMLNDYYNAPILDETKLYSLEDFKNIIETI